MRLPPEFTIEIDGLFKRLEVYTHYEILGITPSADRASIASAYARRMKRTQSPVQVQEIPQEYRDRIERVRAAIEFAHSTLSDPRLRAQYDQSQAAQFAASGGGHELPRSARAQEATAASFVQHVRTPLAPTSPTPPASTPTQRDVPGSVVPPPIAPVPYRPPSGTVSRVQPDSPPPRGDGRVPAERIAAAFTPPPMRRTEQSAPVVPKPFSPSGSQHPAVAPARSPSSHPPGGTSIEARLAALEAEATEARRETAIIMADLERVTASTQLCLAQLSDDQGPRYQQMAGAIQALSGTRATLASMMAVREETEGRWEVAAQLWQRAARSRPSDPQLLVRAANAIRRAGGEVAVAESLLRQAIEIDASCREAHDALLALPRRG